MNERGFAPYHERGEQSSERKGGLSKKELAAIAAIVSTLGLGIRDAIRHDSPDEGSTTKDTTTEHYRPPVADSVPSTQSKERKTVTVSERPDTLKENLNPDLQLEEVDRRVRSIIAEIDTRTPEEKERYQWTEIFTNPEDPKRDVHVSYGNMDEGYLLSGRVHDGKYEYMGFVRVYSDSIKLNGMEIRSFIPADEDTRPEFRFPLQFDSEQIGDVNPALRAYVLGLVNTELDVWREDLQNPEPNDNH